MAIDLDQVLGTDRLDQPKRLRMAGDSGIDELTMNTLGFHHAVLTQAGITPSGTPDNALSSQILDGLKALCGGGGGGGVYTAFDANEMAAILADGQVPLNSPILVVSSGYLYRKRQGVATDDDLVTITENRGTTTSLQYYGSMTVSDLNPPYYAATGGYCIDTGTDGATYILTLVDGHVPVLNIEGARFKFTASRASLYSPSVDFSAIMNLPPGSVVKDLVWPSLAPVDFGQIKLNDLVEVQVWPAPLGQYAIIKNSANYQLFDNFTTNIPETNVQDVLDRVVTELNNIKKSRTVAALPNAATSGAGTRAFVTDANATTFSSVVAGGGANAVPVYSDGTNWRIG